jgi:hypothetical protein
VVDAVRLAIVRVLNGACTFLDSVAYRPAVVKATLKLPFWWSCQLGRLSITLDRRWQMGYWSSEDAPPAPNGICDACKRRASWLDMGGWADRHEHDEADTKDDYLAHHVVHTCGWCKVEFDSPPANAEELEQILESARSRSVSWRWR